MEKQLPEHEPIVVKKVPKKEPVEKNKDALRVFISRVLKAASDAVKKLEW